MNFATKLSGPVVIFSSSNISSFIFVAQIEMSDLGSFSPVFKSQVFNQSKNFIIY